MSKNAKTAKGKKEVEDVEEPEVNVEDMDLKKKAKKPAAKKPATKKPAAKPKAKKSAGSKTAKPKAKTSGKVSKSGDKVRYFKRIDAKNLTSHGRYTGVTPKQAASKGFTKMVQEYKKKGRAVPPSLTIFLRESTRGSTGKVYGYTAERLKLDSPQELEIVDKVSGDTKKITYEYRNKIRKGDIPAQIGGMKKKKAGTKEKKAKKSTKTGKTAAKKPKASGSKSAKPKAKASGSKTAKPKAKTAAKKTGKAKK
uniref:Chromosomal protein MC1 domain-containing protein n=1 Tax=viral metagenome TaxID=1070528 RepID=A0A6C0CAW7_9ZZZZ